MQFTKLRLEGFKSFVDPTELLIEDGLTGVVGPNGCGKSNLLEALRWVMGESRAKQMRGGGMEDVIFAGCDGRPARARAHVELVIDNGAATAPLAWRELPVIEIARRIQRDTGSDYRLNGKLVRARDVQMLFADAATGAGSPALVRQGQIAEIINAKPKARRRILEDAAGISGLYQRRHESLLKLRDAETNLARLDDVLEALAQQLAALEKQAGAARRYRELSALLRTAETRLLQTRHARAQSDAEKARRAREAGERKLAAREAEAARAERARSETAEALAPLREEEMVAAALHQRLAIERERLAERSRAAENEIRAAEAAAAELSEDRAREARLRDDADGALARIARQEADLDRAAEGAEDRLASARARAEAASDAHRAAEAELDRVAGDRARIVANYESAKRKLSDAETAANGSAARLSALEEKTATLQAAAKAASDAATEVSVASEKAANAASETEAALETASASRATARDAEAGAAKARAEAEAALAALSAERRGLERLVSRDRTTAGILDTLEVEPGWENALGAALGDDLELGALPAAPDAPATGWHPSPTERHPTPPTDEDGNALPSLADFVRGAEALKPRLAAIWCTTPDHGARLQPALPPGGRLVSREGDLWRWDGLSRRAADAPSTAALRLTQLNRLKVLRADESAAIEAFEAADTSAATAASRAAAAAADEATARQGHDVAAAAARDAARDTARQTVASDEAAARLSAHQDACLAAEQTSRAAVEALEEARRGASTAADPAAAETALQAAREAAAEARQAASGAESAAGDEIRAAKGRARRRSELAQERAAWQARAAEASTRNTSLVSRANAAAERLADAQAAPAALEEEASRLATALDAATQRRKTAGDRLAEGEYTDGEASKAVRLAEGAAGEARASLAALEARLEAAEAGLLEMTARLEEAGIATAAVDDGDAAEGSETEGIRALETEIARLTRARDALGAVNLRADEDAAEIREEREGLSAEKADLDAAVAKLRQAVASLNREGRSRLVTAFEQVNEQFSTLFRTLFGGGEARLVMVEDEDPLEAGLEILCQPPGKKLASLSLLSGGEQTLTALSLIFAVFLCQPSPICVLDEVDAPLDDSNVDRFCNLLDTMRERTDTRFLIITHHPLTMARMDRLFGVTMVERGVSQLVSVDLAAATKMVDA
ncbi:MAG: chromosome segregation protein SMC [Pseudomonadota bacterium]